MVVDAIEDGTRLEPVAAKLYVITDGAPAEDARLVHLWWNAARLVAEEQAFNSCRPAGSAPRPSISALSMT
jgi:hypothetical protein